jgi:xanthine dehydrogenase small subunit
VATPWSQLTLLEPRSVDEAVRLLRAEGPLVPLAGGTDLYVGLHFGTLTSRRFLNLWGVPGLRGIRKRGDTLVIGALATYTDLIESSLVRRHLPILAEASRWVGSVQIQNRGTLGGNLANASPAGDTLPVLAAAEAVVVLRSADGERRVPFTGFYTGYRKTVMRPDELIVAVEVPRVPGRQWFRKVGTRAAQAISKVVMAAVRAPRPRISVGSVAPTVVRAFRTEELLATGGTLAEAQAALADEIQPIDDLRSTAVYRRRVAANLLEQFWRETAEKPRRRVTTSKKRRSELLLPERLHRVDAGGALSGDIAREGGDRDQGDHCLGQDDGVRRAEPEEERARRSGRRERQEGAHHDADEEERAGLPEDHLHDRRPVGAERHPDPDLVASPRHQVGHHAVEADRGDHAG